jgi:hypothetical protein
MKRNDNVLKKTIYFLLVLSLTVSMFCGTVFAAGTLAASYNPSAGAVTVTGGSFDSSANIIAEIWYGTNMKAMGHAAVSGGAFATSLNTGVLASGSYKVRAADLNGGEYVETILNVSATNVSNDIKTGNTNSGGQETSPPVIVQQSRNGNTATISTTIASTVDASGAAHASVTLAQISSAIDAVGKTPPNTPVVIAIKVEASADARSVETAIPKSALNSICSSAAIRLTVSTPVADMTFDRASLKKIAGDITADVKLTASRVDPSTLSETDRNMTGGRPVYDFSLTSNNSGISELGGNVTVSIPYVLKAGEDANAVLIYHMNSATGKPEPVICSYANGKLTFVTNHFSKFYISYKKETFADVSGWYSGYVTYLAARGIMNGSGNQQFAPQAAITRAEVLKILANMSGADLAKYTVLPFTDVKKGDWYAPAAAWGYENGITAGSGGRFDPAVNITRQDLSVMLSRYSEKIAKYSLPKTSKVITFTDDNMISDYAKTAVYSMQQAGIISGRGTNIFSPRENATRAEASKMIAVYLQGMVKTY